MQCPGAGPEETLRASGSPGVGVAVFVLDGDGPVVRTHTRFRKRKRRRAERTFGRHSPDDPVGASAARTVVYFMFAVHNVIAPLIRHPNIAGRDRHDNLPFVARPTSDRTTGCRS